MMTTEENGKALGELLAYMESKDYGEKELLLYGDCPGLSFMLEKPFAISTAWPDLGSYPYDSFVEELESLEIAPVVIIRNVSMDEQSGRKKEYLTNFLQGNAYVNVFNNGTYGVYTTENTKLQ